MSTLPEGWLEEDDGEEYEEAMTEQLQPLVVPVRVVESESKRVPPEFAGMMTWPVPQAPSYVGIVQRSYERYKAKFIVNFPGAGTLYMNTKIDPLTNPTPQGFSLTVAAGGNASLPDYDCQQALYVCGSIAGITIAVMDERFGKVQ